MLAHERDVVLRLEGLGRLRDKRLIVARDEYDETASGEFGADLVERVTDEVVVAEGYQLTRHAGDSIVETFAQRPNKTSPQSTGSRSLLRPLVRAPVQVPQDTADVHRHFVGGFLLTPDLVDVV